MKTVTFPTRLGILIKFKTTKQLAINFGQLGCACGQTFDQCCQIGKRTRVLFLRLVQGEQWCSCQAEMPRGITETSPGNNRRIVLFFSAKLLEGLSTIQKEDGELAVGLTFQSKLKLKQLEGRSLS